MVPRATAVFILLAVSCRRAEAPAPAPPAAQSCLDAQLAQRGLNPYGDPPDTVYTGGTPLFDERTGRRVEREEYVFAKHPEIARACGKAD